VISHIPFHFFISDESHPMTLRSALWEAPIPSSRLPGPAEAEKIGRVSYGDYFLAVESFLSGNDFKPLLLSVSSCTGLPAKSEHIECIRVFLVKHGEFYHPSHIEADIGGNCFKFVLNVATAPAGFALINREYNLLDHLGRCFPYGFIPRVYDIGRVKTSVGRPVEMFIGEWFEGFYEFHLSHDPGSGRTGIVVWDGKKGPHFLSEAQVFQLYEHIAHILTAYYNPFTFEHIFSWHHAAGDFILKKEKGNLSIRLITIRNYGPMLENAEKRLETVLDGLLIFLMNLSIRLRVDRLDGVGEYAWAGEQAAKGTVWGFFNGLDRQVGLELIPIELADGFKSYLSAFSEEDLLEWFAPMIGGFHPDTPGLTLILNNLDKHVRELYHYIKNFLYCV
jgi:hypothetical protein